MGVTAAQGSAGLKPGVCTSTTRPSNPFEGQMIYETDTDLTYIYGGSAWQQVSGGTAVGNSGLVYVTSATVGTGVSTVTVSGAFSATYDTYKIIWTDGTASQSGTQIGCQMGATTSGYKGNLVYQVWNSATVLGANAGTAKFQFLGGEKTGSANGGVYVNFELTNPFLTKYTYMVSQMYGGDTTSGSSQGVLTNSTSYSAFTLTPDAGTMTGGTITVYGYRKA